MPGYHGRYLLLEIDRGDRTVCSLREREARALLGGPGLAARWLYRHTPAGVDPFSAENALVLATSPLVDTGVTTSSRACFSTRSPQTGFLGESLVSSRFAVALKRTGWDGLVILGALPRLSVLAVEEGEIRIVPAPELAGLSTAETEQAVRASLGSRFQVAAIGPAGERRVRYATVSHDGRHAGRTGLGAVLGAKNLKAIAVAGERRLEPADAAGLLEAAAALRERSRGPETAKYRLLGTSGNLLTFDRVGVLPTRNFQQAVFPGAARLTGEALARGGAVERSGCYGCTIGCEHRYAPAPGGAAVRAEYESLFALGPLLGLDDRETVLQAAGLADSLGLDTLSLGGTLAWAMESVERGVLGPERLDGLDLRFGNSGAVLEAIRRIGHREGPLGELLADGSLRAAARVGCGSDRWSMQVKGLELPGYEPRALKSLALGLAVGARGACHNRSSAYDADFARLGEELPDAEALARSALDAEDRAAVMDGLGLCKFLRRCFDDFYGESARLLELVTGWAVDGPELRAAGSRTVSLKRLYNQREDATRADDTLPPRLLQEAVHDGPRAGDALTRADLDRLLDAYYALREWSPDGTVPPNLAASVLA
ncbi:MAG: aldehyde ferredoxin oxidoreductase family protein [Armatimonadota bacterium]